jgi:hypothetical protein
MWKPCPIILAYTIDTGRYYEYQPAAKNGRDRQYSLPAQYALYNPERTRRAGTDQHYT